MSKLVNTKTNNGLTVKSELIINKITLEGTDDATDFNSGTLKISGGLSVNLKTYLLGDLTLGDELFINNNKNINFQDNTGSNTVMLLQSDNIFVHYGSDAIGNLTPAWAIPMRNSNPAFFMVYPQINLNSVVASPTGGSLQLYGGMLIRNTTDSTSLVSNASFVTYGGLNIGKSMFIGGKVSMEGTTSYLRPPRLTTTQRNALNSSTPLAGMQIFNTTTGFMEYYNGSAWVQM